MEAVDRFLRGGQEHPDSLGHLYLTLELLYRAPKMRLRLACHLHGILQRAAAALCARPSLGPRVRKAVLRLLAASCTARSAHPTDRLLALL